MTGIGVTNLDGIKQSEPEPRSEVAAGIHVEESKIVESSLNHPETPLKSSSGIGNAGSKASVERMPLENSVESQSVQPTSLKVKDDLAIKQKSPVYPVQKQKKAGEIKPPLTSNKPESCGTRSILELNGENIKIVEDMDVRPWKEKRTKSFNTSEDLDQPNQVYKVGQFFQEDNTLKVDKEIESFDSNQEKAKKIEEVIEEEKEHLKKRTLGPVQKQGHRINSEKKSRFVIEEVKKWVAETATINGTKTDEIVDFQKNPQPPQKKNDGFSQPAFQPEKSEVSLSIGTINLMVEEPSSHLPIQMSSQSSSKTVCDQLTSTRLSRHYIKIK